MEELKEAGYWLVGLDERADRHHSDVDLAGPVGIVMGGEGKGLHQLVRERCDFLVAIPTSGPVRSLNVSVAAGIALFEVVRQRSAKARVASASQMESAASPADIAEFADDSELPEADE